MTKDRFSERMPGNLKIIDEYGVQVPVTQPTDEEKLPKPLGEDDSKKLLFLFNDDLNDVAKTWTVQGQEDGSSVEIHCDGVGGKECRRDLEELQEHLHNLKSDVIDFIPSKQHTNILRNVASNEDDLDQAKTNLSSSSSDASDRPPSSRQNQSFTSPSYDYPDLSPDRSDRPPSSSRNRSFISPPYDYPELSPDRADRPPSSRQNQSTANPSRDYIYTDTDRADRSTSSSQNRSTTNPSHDYIHPDIDRADRSPSSSQNRPITSFDFPDLSFLFHF